MQRTLLYTALGAFGLGALWGWAVTGDIHENNLFAERASFDHIIKRKTEHIWILQKKIEHDFAKKSNQMVPGGEEPESIDEDDIVTIIEDDDDDSTQGETLEETRNNLQNLIDTYTEAPDKLSEIDTVVEQAVDFDKVPPFVISQATYAYDEEGEDYSKITLTYYSRDRTLLDDDEDPIEDVPRTIGWRNLTHFGGESGDPDVVFVRNRQLQTDFEVVKEDGRLPLHIQYGMPKEEFRANRAAGLIKLRREDE